MSASTTHPNPETLAARLLREGLIDLSEVASRAGVHVVTVSRWVRVGINGRRLEAIRAGNGWRTSWAAFERFLS